MEEINKKRKTDLPVESVDDDSPNQAERRKYSKAACLECKNSHRKCDGGHPCMNCVKKGCECNFADKNKRGPKTISHYKEIIQTLASELDFYKQKVTTTQLFLENSTPVFSIDLTSPKTNHATSLVESNFVVGQELQTFLTAFYACIELRDLVAPSLDELRFGFAPGSPVPLERKFKWLYIIAIGAQTYGCTERATYFSKMARQMEPELFDKVESDTALGFAISGYFYALAGDFAKAARNMALGLSMCDNLHLKKQIQSNEYASVLLGAAEMATDPRISLLQCQRAKGLNNLSKINHFFRNILEARSLMQIAEKEDNLDVQYVTELLDSAEIWANNLGGEDSYSIVHLSAKAYFYRLMNKKELAVTFASRSLELMSNLDARSFAISASVISMSALLRVFHDFDVQEKLLLLWNRYQDVAQCYPLAHLSLQKKLSEMNVKLNFRRKQEYEFEPLETLEFDATIFHQIQDLPNELLETAQLITIFQKNILETTVVL